MENYRKFQIFYAQSSDWQVAVTLGLSIFSNIQIYSNIQVYIREYFIRIFFFILFTCVTQDVKNNIHICICRICILKIIFIFIFVHQKNYLLHSESNPIFVWGEMPNPYLIVIGAFILIGRESRCLPYAVLFVTNLNLKAESGLMKLPFICRFFGSILVQSETPMCRLMYIFSFSSLYFYNFCIFVFVSVAAVGPISVSSSCCILFQIKILHTAHCTLHNAHCTLITAYCTLHTAYCTLHIEYCILHTAHCTLRTQQTAH